MLLESIDNSMKSGKYMKNEEFNKETEIIKKKKKRTRQILEVTNSMNKMKKCNINHVQQSGPKGRQGKWARGLELWNNTISEEQREQSEESLMIYPHYFFFVLP